MRTEPTGSLETFQGMQGSFAHTYSDGESVELGPPREPGGPPRIFSVDRLTGEKIERPRTWLLRRENPQKAGESEQEYDARLEIIYDARFALTEKLLGKAERKNGNSELSIDSTLEVVKKLGERTKRVCSLQSCNISTNTEGALLQVCGRCKKAWYCSREHQRQHWKAGHKQECKA